MECKADDPPGKEHHFKLDNYSGIFGSEDHYVAFHENMARRMKLNNG